MDDRSRELLGEFFRELAVLWVAFSILDSALGRHPDWAVVLGFFSVGLLSLAIGLWLGERR